MRLVRNETFIIAFIIFFQNILHASHPPPLFVYDISVGGGFSNCISSSCYALTSSTCYYSV